MATALPELDLFVKPPYQTMIEKDVCTEHRPISTISSDSQIQFVFHTAENEFVQFRETELFMELRVDIKKKGVETRSGYKDDDWANISPCNYMLHSMIKTLSVSINNEQIGCSSPTYPYRAYIEALLGYSKDARSSHLQSALWFDDDCDKMDEVNKTRAKFIKGSDDKGIGKILQLAGRLHIDMAFQPKALLGGCSISISILPHDPKFYLMYSDSYEVDVNILNASLFVHRSIVNQKVVEAIKSALKISNAKYYFTRVDVLTNNISKGSLDAYLNNVVNGYLPRRIFIAFVSSDAYNGKRSKNPFSFQHFNVNYLVVKYNGEQFPLKAYQPDFENGKYIREFLGLYEAANHNEVTSNIQISRKQYEKGFTIFGFNFAPDFSEGAGAVGHLCKEKPGSLDIHVKFSKPLEETINPIIYAEFDNHIEITGVGNVKKDWS